MFQIGFGELIVCMIVAIVVFGPERLPAIARVITRWLQRAKRTYTSIKQEFDAEFRERP